MVVRPLGEHGMPPLLLVIAAISYLGVWQVPCDCFLMSLLNPAHDYLHDGQRGVPGCRG